MQRGRGMGWDDHQLELPESVNLAERGVEGIGGIGALYSARFSAW